MPRLILVLLVCLAPLQAIAQSAHRQPTPEAVAKPSTASATTAVDDAALRKAQAETDARSKAWDAKLKKTMGGVCRGC